jgi:hypothetical protein
MSDLPKTVCPPTITTPHPDYGVVMWDSGARTTRHYVMFRALAVFDYGQYREVSGPIWLDNGAYTVSVRTAQTKEQIFAKLTPEKMLWGEGKVSPVLEQGDSGERYRVLLGSVR